MNVISADSPDLADWLLVKEAAALVKKHPDTVKRRAIPWEDKPVAGMIRYADDIWGKRRYYRPDMFVMVVPDAEVEKKTRQRRLFSRVRLLPAAFVERRMVELSRAGALDSPNNK